MNEQYKELLVARYYVEHIESVAKAAVEIVEEESVGTWTDLRTTEGRPHVARLRAEVLDTKVFKDYRIINFKSSITFSTGCHNSRNSSILEHLDIFLC